jgi:hypothetical protein
MGNPSEAGSRGSRERNLFVAKAAHSNTRCKLDRLASVITSRVPVATIHVKYIYSQAPSNIFTNSAPSPLCLTSSVN